LLACALAVGACKQSSAPTPSATSSTATAADSGLAPEAGIIAPADAGSAVPRLTLAVDKSPSDWKIVSEGLPAVSADGKRAVVLHEASDGGRGYPNRELIFIAVDGDKVEATLPLLVADEFVNHGAELSSVQRAALEMKVHTRIERAHARLATTSWIALRAGVHEWRTDAGVGAYTRPRTADGSAWIASGRLRVEDQAGRLLYERDAGPWKLATFTPAAGLAPCSFEPEVAMFAIDRERRVVVVLVSQMQTRGTDFCGGGDVLHAFRLPR
jgi:hypothetical protein